MTSKPLKISLGQFNPVVGDIAGNLALAEQALEEARANNSDVLVLSELFLLGYPSEDLVLRPRVIDACLEAVTTLNAQLIDTDPAVVIGSPARHGDEVTNSAFVLCHGRTPQQVDKLCLPNYGVFDEERLFRPADDDEATFQWRGKTVGVAICEDIWFSERPEAIKNASADLMVVPNASPWRRTIDTERRSAFSTWQSQELPYVFVNQVGAQDELVFDGASYVWDGANGHTQVLPSFDTGVAHVSLTEAGKSFAPVAKTFAHLEDLQADYFAGVIALRDYVEKNRFPGVVLGLSGGIDSALTAAMAVDGLGADRVWCVMMPSRYTSDESLEDALNCAKALGVRYDTISIAPGVDALDTMLDDAFAGTSADTTEENIQSRLRGLTLMALSNKFGPMVVTTGNKSEVAVGYATLYGDMCGGYNPLKDYYKTEVFALSKWRNAYGGEGLRGPTGEVIPERIISKPPSAELKPDQKDEDSLPAYDVLDDILYGLVDRDESIEDVVARGHDPVVVERIEHLVYISEYKRRQAAPGPKIGGRNFGRDRRYPITNGWRSSKYPASK